MRHAAALFCLLFLTCRLSSSVREDESSRGPPPPAQGTRFAATERFDILRTGVGGYRQERLDPKDIELEVVAFDSQDVATLSYVIHDEEDRVPYICVRVVFLLNPKEMSWRGWVHRKFLTQLPPTREARVLQPSYLCEIERIGWKGGCKSVPAEASVQVRSCTPRNAYVYYAQDERMIAGYILRNQLSDGACQGLRTEYYSEVDRAKPMSLEVYTEQAYLCRDAAAARAGGPCPGGHQLFRGEEVEVSGDVPADGVWPCEVSFEKHKRIGFIAAASVNDYPNLENTKELDRFLLGVPAEQLIDHKELSYRDLIESPDKYKGKILAIKSNNDRNRFTFRWLDFREDRFFFVQRVSMRGGSEEVLFVFRSQKFAAQWHGRTRRSNCSHYEDCNRPMDVDCGTIYDYCDNVAFKARFSGKIVDYVHGQVQRFPLFEIEEFADLSGLYTADK